jgi:hypothetical protein
MLSAHTVKPLSGRWLGRFMHDHTHDDAVGAQKLRMCFERAPIAEGAVGQIDDGSCIALEARGDAQQWQLRRVR